MKEKTIKEVIVKLEKADYGTIWGRCKFNGDLYVTDKKSGKDIRLTLAKLIRVDYPTAKFTIRIANYHRNIISHER